APPFSAAPVGFRHCDCLVVGQSADDCLSLACGTSRNAFDFPTTTPWHVITIGAAPAGSYNEAQVTTPALDFRIDPLIYTGGIDCSDPLPHQTITIDLAHLTFVMPPDRNLCRLGAGTGRLLSWATNVDVAAGRVASTSAPMPSLSGEPQQPQSVVQTRGFFWSHGTVPTSARAGNRDVAFNGRLRDNYTFVHTPSLSTDVINIPRILIRSSVPGCLQCFPVLSTDWIKPLIQPGIGINVLRLLPRPFVAYPDCVGTGTLCGIRRSAEPHIDLSLVFGPDARTAILDSTRFLVTPVESAPIDVARAGDVAAISVPRSWSQLGSVVQAIGASSAGNVDVLSAYQANSTTEAAIPFGGEGFVPSDREGARWLFSKLEQAVYMVGGTRQDSPTSEIWRLDLQTAAWKDLLTVGTPAPVHIRNVGALAYDAPSGRLVVIDDAPLAAPQNARVISFDTRAQTSRVVATLDLSSFVKTSLAVTGDTFVLVGATATNWTGYRFQITSQNKISWLGRTSGQGLVVADPLPWQEGPALFTQSGQSIDTVDLPPVAFTPAGTPPELRVCDQPLVVPAPPPVVITTCHRPALQPPTPTSACGPIAFQSDAPRDFPLGTRTVTWTLTDTFGNVVSVPQTVTAILGDDASCCPAGTNIIVGTPNGDNLVGTAGSDCIVGLGAQDTISGGGGDDFISGGDGDDVIDGGSGNDRIWGGSGQDQITGGTGNDVIDGGDGDDACHGGDGNDIIHGGDGQDHLFGENDDDQLFGEGGDDTLDGGPGNDLLNGGGLHDVCVGGTGTNTFVMCQTVQ
ncbi:MAG TPA: calcium-binding protein, partial [Polyangia bacterium]